MLCGTCKKPMKKRKKNYQYKESGLDNVILKGTTVYQCPHCSEVVPEITNIKELHRTIARVLTSKKSFLSGKEIVFLRKEMRLKAKDLSQILGVHKVTVSRWENDKEPIGASADRLLRLLYDMKLLQNTIRAAKADIERRRFVDISRKFESFTSQAEERLRVIRGKTGRPEQITIPPRELASIR